MAKIVIVGGGVSGLSAGIFACLNGFDTEIYESNTKIGGECISWDRQGYRFDGSVQWLVGTREGTDLNDMWKTLGAFDNDKVRVNDIFLTVEHNGQKAYLYRDVEKLEKHWCEVSPEDKKLISEFCKYAKKAKGFSMPVNKNMVEMGVLDYMKMGPKMMGMSGLMMKYGKTNGDEYYSRFKSPLIRNALKTLALPCYPAYSAASIMGSLYANDGGWPMGGSTGITSNMCEKFKSLGGKIYNNAPVDKIILDGNKAIGIELADGKRVKADYVVSSTDISVTLNKLLEGKVKDDSFEEILHGTSGNYQFGSCVYVGVGVNADLSEYDQTLVTTLEKTMTFGKDLIEDIHITVYNDETGFAPKGKSVAKTIIQLYDYEYWENLAKDKDAYKQVKENVAEAVIKHMEKVYPKSKGQVEVVDVATPVTYNRYCGAYHGAWMGYAANAKAKEKNHACYLKGIDNLALAGQWLSTPGGLSVAAATGKFAIQEVCSSLKVSFKE